MTRQSGEVVIYLNQYYRTQTQPLKGYLDKLPAIPKRSSTMTANTRGYVGKWEVRNDELFLIGLSTNIYEGLESLVLDYNEEESVELDYFFPGHTEIFAKWYNGEIILGVGQVHFQWTFDEYIYLGFKNGKLMYKRNVKTDLDKLKDRENQFNEFWDGFKPKNEY